MSQNIRTFIDSLDNFIKQMQKEAADEYNVGASSEDTLVEDTEVDIPRDENVTEYDYNDEEIEDKLDEDYHGHAGSSEPNEDSDELPHRRTDESPDVEEAGEGEIPKKRKAKDLGETSTDITTKESNYKLAQAIKSLCSDIQSLIKYGEVGFVSKEFSQNEKAAASAIAKEAYDDANLALNYLSEIQKKLVKISQEAEEKIEEKVLEEEKKRKNRKNKAKQRQVPEDQLAVDMSEYANLKEGADEEAADNKDLDVAGSTSDLLNLLDDLARTAKDTNETSDVDEDETGTTHDEGLNREESTLEDLANMDLGQEGSLETENVDEEELDKNKKKRNSDLEDVTDENVEDIQPPPEPPDTEELSSTVEKSSQLMKQAKVVAQLFSEALDYLGITPHELKVKSRLNKYAAAKLANAVSWYRLNSGNRSTKLGRSTKYAKLFRQLTDYIREIMGR